MVRTIAVAGSTGSIGTQTLEVVADAPDEYRVQSLMAGSSADQLIGQAQAANPDVVVIGAAELADQVRAGVPEGTEVLVGAEAMAECAARADVTVNGIVGFAGLSVTLACLEAGKRLALANKESLIAAGPVVQQARRTPGAELVPVDSEHAAIHMCLAGTQGGDGAPGRGVARLQLTASGGPFRGRSRAELEQVTVAEALEHPTWSMGPKITIDSSTLMNKGLEVIEANELFGLPAGDDGVGLDLDGVEVVVHPQSIVHSMATFTDGATIAQLSLPTMKLPIAYALAYPERFETAYGAIDWATVGSLDFEQPDTEAFPCLDLCYAAGRIGGTAPAWLSAANEEAVDAFLKERIRWVDIALVNESVLASHDGGTGDTLDGVLEGDALARARAGAIISQMERA